MIRSSIKIISINTNHSSPPTENALDIAVETGADLILIQEPWFYGDRTRDNWTGARSTAHAGFTQILPNYHPLFRPRTLAYVSKAFSPSVSLAINSPIDTDIQIIDITEGDNTLQVINIYNQEDQAESRKRTLPRCLTNYSLHRNTLLIGDFNTHHPWWNPYIDKPNQEAEDLVEWIEDNNLGLLNKPGVATFLRTNLTNPSILDLAFASETVSQRCINFKVSSKIASDHWGLQLEISGDGRDLVENPALQTRYNTKKADWKLFKEELVSGINTSQVLRNQELDNYSTNENSRTIIKEDNLQLTALLDATATALTEAITKAADTAIPRIKPGAYAKPWWNNELKELRREMTSKQRKIRQESYTTKTAYFTARNTFFQAVKTAKRDHWSTFLEKEDPKSIFKAMKYTKDNQVQRIPHIKDKNGVLQTTFEDKCSAFRETLFPPPPNSIKPQWDNYTGDTNKWEWPELTHAELQHACSSEIQSKTPGPDGITQEIITQAYQAIPEIFFKVYSTMINTGYHPSCWKMATGAILQKDNKEDYTIPKAYRIITLLNCLGKVAERIIAQRLSYLAETTNLIHKTQMGGRRNKSAIDAALLLTNEIQRNKKRGWKTSTLFMDVKGAYDHVAKYRLYTILQQLQLPINLISWVSTFLINRLLRLAFDGQIQDFSTIESGVPQGSPVSPILFLIYIRDLFKSPGITWISYVDDVSLTTVSTSLKKNVKRLELEAKKLFCLAEENCIAFDLAKTDLMHWTTTHQAADSSLKLPNGKIIQPLQSIKWLGIYFDPSLSFKHHIATKVAKARGAFFRMARLANIGNGLTPFALRQLYTACVTSIADYGSVIWWKKQGHFTKLLQGLQNLAMRKILGVFKTAPILPMEVECVLPPPEIRLNAAIRIYALRMLKLAPNHPINTAINRITNPQEPPPRTKNKAPLQLQTIYESIKHLYQKEDLETIQHHYFAPWNKDMPYKVIISKLSKDEEAKQHQKALQENPPNSIFIYTDASATTTRESTGIGVGLAVLSPPSNHIHHESTVNLGQNQLVYNGELEGATQAIEYAARIAKPGLHFHIYSDNQAGLWRLKKPSDNPGQACQIRAINAAKQLTNKQAEITLHWVPGHTDLEGNERADALAKAATFIPPSYSTTSFAMLGLRVKQIKTVEWNQKLSKNSLQQRPTTSTHSYRKLFRWELKSKLRVPQGTPRQTASALYQLKLGHGYFKAYLHKLHHIDNDRCKCGVKETPDHLLLSCPEAGDARKKMKDRLNLNCPLTLNILLHTTKGIEATISFLKETKIATKGWLTKRREEEGIEEEED